MRRAARDLHLDSSTRIVIAVLTAAGVLVGLIYWGSVDASRDELIARGCVAAVVILLFPLVWFLHILRLPPEMHAEKEQRISQLSKDTYRQELLDRIAAYRADLIKFRNSMRDPQTKKTVEAWADEFQAIEGKIAAAIHDFASGAEATLYRVRGNLIRKLGGSLPAHQLYDDIATHDIDHLKEFIADYSRGKRD